jgi:hypothetical protein
LTACDPAPSIKGCPAAIPPSQCAVDWYAATPTPACFDDYMDKIERQQQLLKP